MALHLGLSLLLALPSLSSASLLRNVSETVFGSHLGILPLAFGDFNADKLTDIFVLASDRERARVSVMLASSQNTFAIQTGMYFEVQESAIHSKLNRLTCYLNGYEVRAAAPADFDGDGGMDLLVVAEDLDEGGLTAIVLWGNHKQGDGGNHVLVCPADAMKNGWYADDIKVKDEPLVVDGNGDAVADLFGTDADGNRGLWIFGKERKKPHFVAFGSAGKLRRPHSNAFIDLNNDGNADILATTDTHFELWEDVGPLSPAHFLLRKNVSLPKCQSAYGEDGPCIGQAVFADFDLDGRLDVIFPACVDGCKKSTLFYSAVGDLWESNKKADVFKPIPLDLLERYEFAPSGPASSFYSGLSPHVGDINLDGYPDLLLRLRDRKTKKSQMHLLLNVMSSKSPTTHQRGFRVQPKVMEGLNDTVVATFYDLYEDGTNDIITVEDVGGEGETFRIGAFTNATQDSDAYFVKVIVLSGVCYQDCTNGSIQVPYGTNLPGQTICYRTQRQVEETFAEVASCAPQLPQTAHHALQLPYTIFGLGLAPNFLDYMYVNVTNASASHSQGHTWPQIIPNSQMYVIPHPPSEPNRWEAKLFITPGRSILLTFLSLLGTCGVVLCIALVFHLRERRADRREMMQDTQRFHFDAM